MQAAKAMAESQGSKVVHPLIARLNAFYHSAEHSARQIKMVTEPMEDSFVSRITEFYAQEVGPVRERAHT
eukprot:8652353-Karenia_brevis.AAC.1